MNDLISRQELIDICNDVIEGGIPNELGLHPIVVEAVKFIVETMPSAQQWIPCSERLPDDGSYLCSELGGFCYTDNFKDGKWGLADKCGAICIAWMPLPEPCKGEKDECTN